MIPGTSQFDRQQDAKYSRIFGAVQWPSARPGFMVIVGERREEFVLGLPKIELLDEASSSDLWDLVRMCAALSNYYHPERFWSDGEEVAAMQFAAECSGLRIDHSLLCAMPGPFAYAFPVLKRAIQIQRLVIPAGSEMNGQLLAAPAMEELGKLKLSDYPAIAALAYAVLGLEATPRAVASRQTSAKIRRPLS